MSLYNEKSKILRLSWQAWLGFVTLGAAFLYVWILPVFWPRGDFLWGYYSLKDIYLGIPIGLAFLGVLFVFAVPNPYKRPLALRLASVSISLLIAFFLCDAVYALVLNGAWQANFWLDQGHIARRYSVADDELGFVRKPEVSWRGFVPEADRIVDYRTDKNGFRNPFELSRADVVFIGDSFTEAATVDEKDTFVRQVGEHSGLSVVNLGRGAYGPQQEFIVLKRYGLAYHPRVVVWQLFEGNDLPDARLFTDWKANPQQGDMSLKQRYFENSLLAEWIPRGRRLQSGVPLVNLQRSDGSEIRIPLRYRYDPEEPSKEPIGFAGTTQAIEQGYRLCQSRGIELLVIFVPTMVRVMEPYLTFDRAEDKSHYLPNDVDNEKDDFSGRLAEFCDNLGCSFVDALTDLREAAAADNRNLYVPVDEHLDIQGHRVIAQTILDWIRTQTTSEEMK